LALKIPEFLKKPDPVDHQEAGKTPGEKAAKNVHRSRRRRFAQDKPQAEPDQKQDGGTDEKDME
jgi:hypothetical protein